MILKQLVFHMGKSKASKKIFLTEYIKNTNSNKEIGKTDYSQHYKEK